MNFDIPQTTDEYIHRAGRTARMHAKGLVSTIATLFDRDMVKRIEEVIQQELPRCTVAGVEPFEEIKAKPFKGRPKSRW